MTHHIRNPKLFQHLYCNMICFLESYYTIN